MYLGSLQGSGSAASACYAYIVCNLLMKVRSAWSALMPPGFFNTGIFVSRANSPQHLRATYSAPQTHVGTSKPRECQKPHPVHIEEITHTSTCRFEESTPSSAPTLYTITESLLRAAVVDGSWRMNCTKSCVVIVDMVATPRRKLYGVRW